MHSIIPFEEKSITKHARCTTPQHSQFECKLLDLRLSNKLIVQKNKI